MKEFSSIKKYDAAAYKNSEENEERNESFNVIQQDVSSIIVKSIHNKRNEFK